MDILLLIALVMGVPLISAAVCLAWAWWRESLVIEWVDDRDDESDY